MEVTVYEFTWCKIILGRPSSGLVLIKIGCTIKISRDDRRSHGVITTSQGTPWCSGPWTRSYPLHPRASVGSFCSYPGIGRETVTTPPIMTPRGEVSLACLGFTWSEVCVGLLNWLTNNWLYTSEDDKSTHLYIFEHLNFSDLFISTIYLWTTTCVRVLGNFVVWFGCWVVGVRIWLLFIWEGVVHMYIQFWGGGRDEMDIKVWVVFKIPEAIECRFEMVRNGVVVVGQ